MINPNAFFWERFCSMIPVSPMLSPGLSTRKGSGNWRSAAGEVASIEPEYFHEINGRSRISSMQLSGKSRKSRLSSAGGETVLFVDLYHLLQKMREVAVQRHENLCVG